MIFGVEILSNLNYYAFLRLYKACSKKRSHNIEYDNENPTIQSLRNSETAVVGSNLENVSNHKHGPVNIQDCAAGS